MEDMQARCKHSFITTAQHTSLVLPHPGIMATQHPPTSQSRCQPRDTALLAQSASKRHITHLTLTWIYTESDAGGCWDYKPGTWPVHVVEERETVNRHWNRGGSGWMQEKYCSHENVAYRDCAVCRKNPRVTWPDLVADPPLSRGLQ